MSSIAQLIHPEGWRFFAIFVGITIVLSFFSETLTWIGLILSGWCFYFFRNPKRVTPCRDGLIISPADGTIVAIEQVVPPTDWDIGSESRVRISVFLNVFDVHINRIPIASRILRVIYEPGRFFNASLDKASEFNERNTLVLETSPGKNLAVVQIAGLVARRIRCDVAEKDSVPTGLIYGIIRFGSRVDLYLPVGTAPLVIVGQRVIGGETVMADLTSEEPARVGEIVGC